MCWPHITASLGILCAARKERAISGGSREAEQAETSAFRVCYFGCLRAPVEGIWRGYRAREYEACIGLCWQGFGLGVYCFGCLKGASKSGQVLLNGMEAVLVLTLIILK